MSDSKHKQQYNRALMKDIEKQKVDDIAHRMMFFDLTFKKNYQESADSHNLFQLDP